MMDKGSYGYTGPEEFRPISPWGYAGYTFLLLVPFFGFFFLLYFSFSSKNIHRRSFARSFWILPLVIVMYLLLWLLYIVICVFFFPELRTSLRILFETFCLSLIVPAH